MKKVLAIAGAFALSVGVVPLGAFAAGNATIENTGPDSQNEIVLGYGGSSHYKISNDTDVDFDVSTDQNAESGNALVHYNTHGGDASTGDADNENELSGEIAIENNSASGSSCNNCGGDYDASIDTTGPGSTNIITVGGSGNGCGQCGGHSGSSVDNDTDVSIDVDTDQKATTGNAKVHKNTNGGNATTGDASNTNSLDVEVHVTNHAPAAITPCGCNTISNASIDTTGPGSSNVIHAGGGSGSHTNVHNDTNVNVNNNVNQSATTGNATVSHNTNAGNAGTGNAGNANSGSLNFSVSNN